MCRRSKLPSVKAVHFLFVFSTCDFCAALIEVQFGRKHCLFGNARGVTQLRIVKFVTFSTCSIVTLLSFYLVLKIDENIIMKALNVWQTARGALI